MKTIIILLLAFNLNAQGDSWKFSTDKQLHFGVGFTLGYVFTDLKLADNNYKTFEYFTATQMLMFPIGMTKEWADLTFITGRFSWQDIAYNQIGALVGTAAKFGVNKWIQHRKIHNKAIKL